jgi:hypothetical protein
LQSAWKRKDHQNLKILWYEDMKKDITGTIKDLCDFLGYPLSPDVILSLSNHVSFDSMRNNFVESTPEFAPPDTRDGGIQYQDLIRIYKI